MSLPFGSFDWPPDAFTYGAYTPQATQYEEDTAPYIPHGAFCGCDSCTAEYHDFHQDYEWDEDGAP